MKSETGAVYIVIGDNAHREYTMSRAALERSNPGLPIHLCEMYEHDAAHMSRWAKVHLDEITPFEYTLYIDADTRPRGDISLPFKILKAGWDLCVCPSSQQGNDLLWHIGEKERQKTFLAIGHIPVQLQAGVMYWAKNERTDRLFKAWRKEWEKYGDQDQAALLRALKKSPVRVWLLSHAYNNGSLIAHLHGQARAR